MGKKTMRRFLKKTPTSSSKDAANWKSLYKKAREASRHLEDDPRVRLLRGGQDQPERTLRRLSILSEVDIQREFGE